MNGYEWTEMCQHSMNALAKVNNFLFFICFTFHENAFPSFFLSRRRQ